MREIFLRVGCLTAFFFAVVWSSSEADSLQVKNSKFYAGINLSILNTSNWQGMSLSNFSFSTNIDFSFLKSSLKWNHLYKLSFELGFTRFIDSTWHKHADQISSHYILKSRPGKLSQTMSSIFTTRILNSYEYSLNTLGGNIERKQTGSFFTPSSLEIGYGSGYSFKHQSIINFSIATARFRAVPVYGTILNDRSVPIFTIENSMVYFDYGLSLQYTINLGITKAVEYNANGKVFLKEFNRKHLEMDITNKILIKLLKNLHLKGDFKVAYFPSVSYRFQIRNEFMIGFLYDSTQ